eukprot:6471227-Lingulodinium_polyedra.AAC.1
METSRGKGGTAANCSPVTTAGIIFPAASNIGGGAYWLTSGMPTFKTFSISANCASQRCENISSSTC